MQYSTVSVPMQAPMPYSTARYPIQASVSAAPIAYSAGVSAAPMMPYGTVSVPIGATMQVGMGGPMPPPIMHPDPVRSSTRVMLSRTRVVAACVAAWGA
jgi:hypothetical protein